MGRPKSEVARAQAVLDIAKEFVSVVEDAGGTYQDARDALFKDQQLRRDIGALVAHKAHAVCYPSLQCAPHFVPKGMTFLRDEPPVDLSGIKQMEWYSSKDPGLTMQERVANKEGLALGLSNVPALLEAAKSLLDSLHPTAIIPLTGTVFKIQKGGKHIPVLFRGGWADDPNRWSVVIWRENYFRKGFLGTFHRECPVKAA